MTSINKLFVKKKLNNTSYCIYREIDHVNWVDYNNFVIVIIIYNNDVNGSPRLRAQLGEDN